MQTPQGIAVKHRQKYGVNVYIDGVGALEQNAFVDPRRLAKAFFFMRNGQKVYHIHPYQHKKRISKSLINRVETWIPISLNT